MTQFTQPSTSHSRYGPTIFFIPLVLTTNWPGQLELQQSPENISREDRLHQISLSLTSERSFIRVQMRLGKKSSNRRAGVTRLRQCHLWILQPACSPSTEQQANVISASRGCALWLSNQFQLQHDFQPPPLCLHTQKHPGRNLSLFLVKTELHYSRHLTGRTSAQILHEVSAPSFSLRFHFWPCDTLFSAFHVNTNDMFAVLVSRTKLWWWWWYTMFRSAA